MRLLIEKDDGELVPVKAIETVSPDSSILLLHSCNYLRKDDMGSYYKSSSTNRRRKQKRRKRH